MEHPGARCDGCGGNLEQQDPVIFDCFHALHAACAGGSDACPRCRTPRTRPPVAAAGAAGAAPASPPDSSVAGSIRSNGDELAAGEGEGPPVIQCDECGGRFRPTETGLVPALHPVGDETGGAERALGSPTPSWSTWWSSFGSPERWSRSPSPPHVDQFEQPPPAAMATLTAPSQYGGTVPFGQPTTAAPVNPFQPLAQFAPPPPVFQQYPHTDLYGPPPYFYGQLPPAPPLQQQNYHFQQTSTLGYQQQPAPLPAPACFAYAPPPAVSTSPYCAACGGAVVRGQTAVTSQCNHTFHFRCFAGGAYACPACGTQWSDVGPAIQPPPYRY